MRQTDHNYDLNLSTQLTKNLPKSLSNNKIGRNLVNIMIICAIILLIALQILKIWVFPLIGDDWVYGSVYPINSLFFAGYAWHPGRHISEFMNIIPGQIYGRLLGMITGDALFAVKLISRIFAVGIIGLFYFVSLLYLPIKNRSVIVNLFIVVLLSFYFFNNSVYLTRCLIIVGGFVLALISWLPFYYYYQKNSLPQWMNKNPIQTYGIMLVVFYLGTQIQDTAYFVTVSLSIMLFAYLLGQKFYPAFFEKSKLTEENRTTLFILLIMHIVYGCYAFFRNTVMAPEQAGFRALHRTFDLIEIYKRISYGPFLQDVSILCGGILIVYFLYKFVKNKMIMQQEYFYFSLCVVTLFWIFTLSSVVRTPFYVVLWVLWICEFSILLTAYNKNNKLVQLLLPILLFGIFIDVFKRDREYLEIPQEWFYQDEMLVEYFKDAQLINKESVEIPIEIAKKSGLVITKEHTMNPSRDISKWMLYHGYTDKYIPIIYISNQ